MRPIYTGEQYPMRRVSLRFVDSAVEREYRRTDIDLNRPLIRTYLLAAAALFLSFGALDMVVGGAHTGALLFVRYALITPLLLGIALLTYRPVFIKYAQILLVVATAAPGLAIIYMTAILDGPPRSEYYAGMIMVVIYGSALIRLQYYNAFFVSASLIALYQVVAIFINPIPRTGLISNDFFLVMAAAVGIFSGYLQEVAVRDNFRSRKLLEQKNQESLGLLLQAQAASRAKDEFVANMSHELRTPLNAIIGFSQIMEDGIYGKLGDDRYDEYARYIRRSGSHLLEVINGVLDLAKADAGKLKLQERPCDIGQCITDAVMMCSELARAMEVKLAVSCPDGLVARIDERLVRQVLINLISNAVKFSAKESMVEITVRRTAQDLAINVSDHGIGIAPEDIQRIMRPFEQVESTYSRAHGGTGLGLPLARKFIELHGGHLEISSEIGMGTTVTLHLPAERLTSPADGQLNNPPLQMVS